MSSSEGSKDENEPTRQLDKDITVYPERKLGKGGFGQLYEGKFNESGKKLAIKVEQADSSSHLNMEYKILGELKGEEGIPEVFKFIKGNKHNYMVMELLGRSLDKLFTDSDREFSIKTVCQIGYQMVKRIEYIHNKGYIHRDIKPGNFLTGIGELCKTIYLIDFGLSKKYIDKKTGKHIKYKDGKGLTGTARYVSLYTHYGIEQSRRDDIEGISYILIMFAKGSLPWQGVKAKSKTEKHKKIFEKKKSISPEDICKGLPEEFPTLLKYSRKLDFKETPDYKNIKIMFKNLISKEGFKMDMIFDWEVNQAQTNNSQNDDEESGESARHDSQE